MSSPTKVFFAYSHADEALRDKLAKHLAVLERKKIIEHWHDQMIGAGVEWKQAIDQNLLAADIILLLISADYLASTFCYDIETTALKRHEKGEAHVIPILLRSCDWTGAQFAHLQVLPRNGKPVVKWSDQDDAFEDVSKEIRSLAEEIANRHSRALVKSADVPPKGWLAALQGWFDFHRLRSVREFLINKHKEEVTLSKAIRIKSRAREFTVAYSSFASLPSFALAKSSVIIVSGPAGSGKSRLVEHVLLSRISYDILVRLSPAEVEAAIDGTRTLWRAITEAMGKECPADIRPLTTEAIAYAFVRRRLVLVAEDVHHAGALQDIYSFLQRELDKHRLWGSNFKLILTTRETVAEDSSFRESSSRPVEVIRIGPLEGHEPQNFFLELLRVNQVSIEVAAIGEALAQGFNTPTTRTPLYVVTCAWLAAMAGRAEDVAATLRMDAARIFERFVYELYARVQVNDERLNFQAFRQVYERLALSLWPAVEGMDIGVVQSKLSTLLPSGETGIDVTFFEKSGFLYRSYEPWNGDRYSFPHQTLADYLVASAMVSTGDFAKLSQGHSSARAKELAFFIGDILSGQSEMDVEKKIVEIAKSALPTFLLIAKSHPNVLNSTHENFRSVVEQVVDATVSWMATPTAQNQSAGVFVRMRHLLDERAPWWYERLCFKLAEVGPSGYSVEALAILGGASGHKLLFRWLGRRDAYPTFYRLHDIRQVRDFLVKVLRFKDGNQLLEGWSAFLIGWSSMDTEFRTAAQVWLKSNVAFLGSNQIGELVDLGIPGVKLLVQACEESPIDVKQRVSSAVARKLGKAVLLPGSYEVEDDEHKKIVVKINRPLLVPCQSEILYGDFTDTDDSRRAVLRKTRPAKLMTKYQAFIALTYYADRPNGAVGHCGVIFPNANDFYPEAFRTAPKAIGLFIISDRGRTGIQLASQAPRPVTPNTRRVAYREVEEF